MKFQRGNDNYITGKQIRYNISQSQVSSAKYSDISSQYLLRAKQLADQDIDFTEKNSISHGKLKSNNKMENPSILVDRANVKLDSEEFIQMFEDDDSILSLNKIFPESQFRDNAKELGIKPDQRQSIAYKFYKQKNKVPLGDNPYNNKYYVDYLQWKQYDQQLVDDNLKPLKKKQTLQQAAQDTLIEKELQLKAYKSKILEQNQQKSLNQMRKNLKNISEQYQSKLKSVLDSRWETSPNTKYQQNKRERILQKNRELGFQKIQYPSIKAVQIQQKYMSNRNEQEKWKNINQKSFVDIIKRPPVKIQSENIETTFEQIEKRNDQKGRKNKQVQEDDCKSEAKLSWKLNIEEVLKIPHKQFLLFYNEYERKIVALSCPQQLKQIRKYRSQALQKEEALLKLKNKIATHGQQVLAKLSQEKRRQLFQLLYQDEVQQQKNKQM